MKKYLLLSSILITSLCAAATKQNTRGSSFPFVSGDSFRALAHHIFDETNTSLNPANVKYKDIVFVKTDYLDKYFNNVHPHITQKYFLISHNADHGAPAEFAHYLNDDKILMWFGQNPTIQGHKKFVAIPIGIANRYWPHGQVKTFVRFLKKQDTPKQYLLALNFVPSTNMPIRQPVYDMFINKPFCFNLYNPDQRIYLHDMGKSKFTLSPAGNGLDCHRHWEALLVGSIPVIKTSMLDELLKGLPVLIINDWNEVTEEFLNQKYAEMTARFAEYNLGKIYMPYWIRLIEHYRTVLA